MGNTQAVLVFYFFPVEKESRYGSNPVLLRGLLLALYSELNSVIAQGNNLGTEPRSQRKQLHAQQTNYLLPQLVLFWGHSSLHSKITPGHPQGNIWGTGDLPRVNRV